ncbi:ABC transporter substrate-binding protein [Paenibacillus marchantiophytorum]|uniref:ABC transporter substrate-binding protein n=1 Tax=Paenibacillus marchantiophytorum TaxID=1619310 RepID=A0ABQ1FGE4_9BACL|nr:extracellular solute-binding protein [Paenibacillus marchantiophytorum]GGA11609.1 ABC transporter substrate-binding protein [Paenibacillus marchantiophytorum]
MKKWIGILMSLVFVVSLTACSGSRMDSSNKPVSSSIGNTETPGTTSSSGSTGKDGFIEDESKDSKKTIVVSILSTTDFYKQAKQKYEATHPNTTIQFKEFSPATNGSGVMNPAEVEKYIKQSTTEILSGKGADLFAIATVDLPIEKYIGKKAFVNLDELIKKDKSFDPNLYYRNILDNSKISSGLYVLPTKFYLQMLFGDTNAIQKSGVAIDDKNWTWSQFADVGKQLAAKGVHAYSLDMLEPEEMLNSLVSDNYAQLVDGASRKVNFDSAVFTDLLKHVKSLYDEKIISAKPLPTKDTNFRLSEIYSPKDYLARLALYYKNGTVYQKPHAAGQKSGVAFGGLQTIAMNSNSTIKGTAWDFMKFLLSEEMQSIPQQDGFSMMKSVTEKMMTDLANDAKKGTIDTGKGGVLQVSDKDLQSMKTMISDASLAITPMNKVQTIIAEEAKAYFTGQKSADDVAKLIQNRVTIYINE